MSRDLWGTPGTRQRNLRINSKQFVSQYPTADSLALTGQEFITSGYQGFQSHNPARHP